MDIKNLISCIKVLGFRRGWRYYKINERLKKNKELAYEALKALRERVSTEKDEEIKLIVGIFADLMESCMKNYETKNPNW